MTYLVTDSCVNCKYTDCVLVCPVDCFYEGPNFLAINSDECIDCGVCVSECPVQAIVYEGDIIDNTERNYWLDINELISRKFPRIIKKKDPLPYHNHWIEQPNKRIWLKKK